MGISSNQKRVNTVVLTTETLHHAYFVKKLVSICNLQGVLIEKSGVKPPFETHHPFESNRDEYEMAAWFDGRQALTPDFAPSEFVENINDERSMSLLKKYDPQLIVVVGTRKINSNITDVFGDRLINFHGGNPEKYRGLDSHLWSIYHDDYHDLIVTLHQVNGVLDDGEIVLQKKVPIKRDTKLYELRRLNTETCIEMIAQTLQSFSEYGAINTQPQRQKGRYYSFMPSVLKEVCLKKFEKYTSNL